MNWTEQSIATALGKEISRKAIHCPECLEFEQELHTVGDCEHTLFCPHCELTFEIVIKVLPYPRSKEI